MVTVISNGEGRACDSKCHNAKGSTCHCICGGMNHGAGTNQALQNTQDHFLELTEQMEFLEDNLKETIKEGIIQINQDLRSQLLLPLFKEPGEKNHVTQKNRY